MKKLWKFFSEIGIELESEPLFIQSTRLLNQFTLIIFIVLFIHSLHNFFYINDIYSGEVLLFMSIFFLCTFPLKRLRRIKLLVCVIFILIAAIIFFYESYSGTESGITFYYFPLILAIPFLFSFESDKLYITTILIFTILFIIINIITDYSLFTNHSLTSAIRKNTFFVSLSLSVIIAIVDLIFIFRKNKAIYKFHKISVENKALIQKQQKQINLLQSDEEITAFRNQELTQLVINKDPSFFSIFTKVYPSFCTTLLEYSSDLSISELELCAYIELNFSTKDIARYTSLSVRAVEGRKYRLRKKLNISSEKELVTWMMELNLSKNFFSGKNVLK